MQKSFLPADNRINRDMHDLTSHAQVHFGLNRKHVILSHRILKGFALVACTHGHLSLYSRLSFSALIMVYPCMYTATLYIITCMHVQMGLPMLIKQRLAPACMHAYADVISLGGDLRYPKTVRYIVPYVGIQIAQICRLW